MKHFLAFAYNLHDSSVSIANEERVLLVIEAERYFGEKKMACTPKQMEELVEVALRYCEIGLEDVEAVACTAYRNEHLPEGKRDIAWIDKQPVTLLGRNFEARVVNHHLAHAAIVHAFPDVDDVVIDVCDGGGDFGDTHRIYRCKQGRTEQLPNRPIHNSFSSRFYDVISRHIYGRIMCEGKLMALASLGEPRREMTEFILDHAAAFHNDPPAATLERLGKVFPIGDYVRDRRAHDLAASAQAVFEKLRLQSVLELPSDAPDVLIAGGATLNILANTRIKHELGSARRLLIPPCCDDTGQSLGALLYLCHEDLGVRVTAAMPFLGYSDSIRDRRLGSDDVSDELVDFVLGGGIVLLHRGQSEIGPRALGHRSIVALPSQLNHDLINNVIKGREFYRPLAPIIPLDRVSEWFEWSDESKYMLYAAAARGRTKELAAGICHYDGTARLQTISRSEDPFLHGFLSRIGEGNGCPISINTSLNPRGNPITSTIADTLQYHRTVAGLNVRVFHEGKLLTA